MRVLFVGDKPRGSLDLTAAYTGEGSENYPIISQWALFMGMNNRDIMIIHRGDKFFVDCAKSFSNAGKPVVALGFHAHQSLDKAEILHFSLPSPKSNIKADDLLKELVRCARYIKGCEALMRGF